MYAYLLQRLGAALTGILLTISPSFAQGFTNDDPVIRSMWQVGMEESQTEMLAQILMDYIGPRLSGTQGFMDAVDWVEGTYRGWGIDVSREQYGTWTGWRQGAVHVDLIGPRVQTLEAKILAWSPGTDGPVEGDVITVPRWVVSATALIRSTEKSACCRISRVVLHNICQKQAGFCSTQPARGSR